jgi:N-acyl-D-amino-acid deacylase
MVSYDLVISGGTIIDGTGAPRLFGDIGVRNGIIECISGDLSTAKAEDRINAEGKIVAPGVIDSHTHYDAQINWDPYCTNSSWHGCTTAVVGNCGFGFSPCKPEARDQYMLMMENTEQVPIGAMRHALGWDWESYPEWKRHMRCLPKGINIASYLPLNSLMMYVMGYENAKKRGANRTERQVMRDLLNEAMDAGAIGFGFSYLNQLNTHKDCDGTAMPTDEMAIEDAYMLAEVLKERDQGCIQCLCELPNGVANRHVAEELARISNRPVLHNAVLAINELPDYHKGILGWLDDAEDRSLNIYTMALMYRFWNEFNTDDWDQWQAIPLFKAFTFAGSAVDKARLAADPEFLARARAEYDPMQLVPVGGPLESYLLQDAKTASDYQKFEGRRVGQIATELGRPVTDVFFEIVARSGTTADFRAADTSSLNVDFGEEVLRHKRVIPGTSDGGAHVKFYSGGQYSTDNIMQFVREEQRMTLEEMHYKQSGLPARILGFNKRGTLQEGHAADIYVYDLDELGFDRSRLEVVHDLPDGDWRRVCRAEGIESVIVNGEPIFTRGECTSALPGRMIGNGDEALDDRLRRTD